MQFKTRTLSLAIVACLSFASLLPLIGAFAPLATASSSCKPQANGVGGAELDWGNGKLFCMIGAHVTFTPSAGLLKAAQDLYLAAYFPLPAGCDLTNPSTCGPETLPSGYQPNCNPCFHGGPLNNFPYHDHVLEGVPGTGTADTAGSFAGPWVIIIVVYNPAISNSLGFSPAKSGAAIDAGEASGEFLPINAGAANPFEINTGVVLICPTVQAVTG